MAISDEEATQLARIRVAEADFYAEVLFLSLTRAMFPHGSAMHGYDIGLPRTANAVISAFKDMNERVIK